MSHEIVKYEHVVEGEVVESIPKGGFSQKFDRAGREINLREWAMLMENPGYKRVAFDQISKEIEVSTVWLGLDHQLMHGGPILIFETLVFGGAHDGDMMRYSTEAQAEAGHIKVVNALKREIAKGKSRRKALKRGRK